MRAVSLLGGWGYLATSSSIASVVVELICGSAGLLPPWPFDAGIGGGGGGGLWTLGLEGGGGGGGRRRVVIASNAPTLSMTEGVLAPVFGLLLLDGDVDPSIGERGRFRKGDGLKRYEDGGRLGDVEAVRNRKCGGEGGGGRSLRTGCAGGEGLDMGSLLSPPSTGVVSGAGASSGMLEPLCRREDLVDTFWSFTMGC